MSKYFSAAHFAADADDRDDRSEASATRSAVTDLTDDDLDVENEDELEVLDHDCKPIDWGQEKPTYLNAVQGGDSTVVVQGGDSTVVEQSPIDIGNAGFYCGKWGKRSSKPDMQANIDIQLKSNPAQILGILECSRATECVLVSADRIEPPP